MPAIPNYPQNLMDTHMNWHMNPGNPAAGGRAIDPWPPGATEATPGSGQEFLSFHRGYIAQFHAWYDTQAFADPAAVTPWHSIPSELKMSSTGWPGAGSRYATAENRLTSDLGSFATADDLGRFIEWQIHGWLHGAASAVYGEPQLGTFMSPESTYFWQLHGLVDYWWSQWEARPLPKFHIKELIDTKVTIKREFEKVPIQEKALRKEVKERKEFKEVKEFKEKDKDIFEGGIGQIGDPFQTQVAAGQAFIRPFERPDLGDMVSLNPQPIPPGIGEDVSLNPQPIPPGIDPLALIGHLAQRLDMVERAFAAPAGKEGGAEQMVHPEPKKPEKPMPKGGGGG
jgi:hypothetical protein